VKQIGQFVGLFIGGAGYPVGEACQRGSAFSERAVWPEKAVCRRLSSRMFRLSAHLDIGTWVR